MPAKNPQSVADKWSRNLAGATTAIAEGVNGVTVSPTQKAAARQDAYLAGVQRAVADGKWERGLKRVTLEDWKNAMLKKGLNRIASGASNAVDKMASFLGEFLPHVEAGQRMLENMPRGDLNTNIQRAVAMMEHNSKFRRKG